MAVTKKQEQQYQPQQTQYPSQGYQGLAGVTDNTAKQVQQSQQQYQPGQAVQNAQQQLQQVQTQKPQTYNSKYGAALDNILQQIQNPQQFKYSFDGDELFKYYADLYSQNGRQASMDAMGQAAGLTGGYGNSYAQQAGQQAYDEWMRNLYDKGMDLYDRAYQRYRDDQGDLLNQYNVLAGQDQTEYGRYRDTVGDWENERGYWTDMYNTESDRDYSRWANDRDFWIGLAQVENADYRNEQERQEAIRQYEQNYARSVYESDRDYDRGVLESDRAYDRNVLESDRAFNEQQRQYDTDNQYRYDTFNWQRDTDARDYARNVLESDRAYDRGVLESDRNYDRSVYESDRNFAEEQRQFNWQMNENIRQFNESLNWDKMSNDQKYAAEYALAILQNGQMPSQALLEAAGLSAEDAAKLMAVIQPVGRGGTTKPQTTDNNGKSLYEAEVEVLKSTPLNTTLNKLNPNLSSTTTLGDVKNKVDAVVANKKNEQLKNELTNTAQTMANVSNWNNEKLYNNVLAAEKTAAANTKYNLNKNKNKKSK